MFFIGTFSHNLDEKARVILPSRMREMLGKTVYINLGLDKCLAIYPEETFMKMAQEISQKSSLNPEIRSYKRTFFSNSYPCDIDKQGRIQLTKESIDKCSIKKEVVIIGVDDHIEIWDKDKYLEMEKLGEDAYEENASKMFMGE